MNKYDKKKYSKLCAALDEFSLANEGQEAPKDWKSMQVSRKELFLVFCSSETVLKLFLHDSVKESKNEETEKRESYR